MPRLDNTTLNELYNCILKNLPRDREIVLYWTNGNISADEAGYISRKLNEEGFRSSIFHGDFYVTTNPAERREYPVDLGRMLKMLLDEGKPREKVPGMMATIRVH